jgi:hypothetical protein
MVSFYTQQMIEFFQELKNHDRAAYPEIRQKVFSVAAEGEAMGYSEMRSAGLVLMATTVATLGKHMTEAPDIVQACMAKVLANEIDWEVVAQRFLINEECN